MKQTEKPGLMKRLISTSIFIILIADIFLIGLSCYNIIRVSFLSKDAINTLKSTANSELTATDILEIQEKISDLEAVQNGYDQFGTFLAMFTILLTLPTVIPYLISKSITRHDLQEMFDNEFEKRLDSYNLTLEGIKRVEGHSARMTGYILSQLNDHSWAIGWISQALIKYIELAFEGKSSIIKPEFYKDCIKEITNYNDTVLNSEYEKSIDKNAFCKTIMRSYVDLYDVMAYYLYSDNTKKIHITEIDNNKGAIINVLKALHVFLEHHHYCNTRELEEISNISQFNLKKNISSKTLLSFNPEELH